MKVEDLTGTGPGVREWKSREDEGEVEGRHEEVECQTLTPLPQPRAPRVLLHPDHEEKLLPEPPAVVERDTYFPCRPDVLGPGYP